MPLLSSYSQWTNELLVPSRFKNNTEVLNQAHETIQLKIIKIVSLHTLLVTHFAFSEVLILLSVVLISSFYSYCISSLAALPFA